jgi:Family of unknown function (DUF6866) N-terminal domain/Family of unknown function (DUF6866) C-terminal domain
MLNIDDITRQVIYNCDISDAYHAGMFSICGLALRLRDLYKWEMKLPVWEERDAGEILEWIEAKENKWEKYAENDYKDLIINGSTFDPFDTVGINRVLEPHHIFYGAGYARSLKPTFFLADITEKTNLNGNTVYTLGCELARDLLTIPALTQDNWVVLRQESAKLFIWDSILYIKKSARPALKFALDSCGFKTHEPKSLQPHLATILAIIKENYIYHEIGEMLDTDFDRNIWREVIAAFPSSPVEYLARAVKDLLADTNDHGTLKYITKNRNTASLAFYAAFLDGLAKEFFPEFLTSFRKFTRTKDWGMIDQAVSSGYDTAKKHAALITDLYLEGLRKNDKKWAEIEIQSRLLGK